MVTTSMADGLPVYGAKVSDHLFIAKVKTAQLFMLAPNPLEAEDKKKVLASRELQELAEMRRDVQRLFEGQKEKNAPRYADYMIQLSKGENGVTPVMILWTESELGMKVDENGVGYVVVPYETPLVAIDGDTQLAGRYIAAQLDPQTKGTVVPIYIAHGKTKDWARQSFHDVNVLAVRPNAALSLAMDNRDPLTHVARDLEKCIPFFSGRVDTQRRQLGRNDASVVTITALRGACVTLAEGIAGVKYGTRPVALASERVSQVRAVALEWFGMVTDTLGAAMNDRYNKLASAPTVLAAIGAMGNELLPLTDAINRANRAHALIDELRQIDWRRGPHWDGVAGKWTPKGILSIGGTKEYGHLVYGALHDANSEAYHRIRTPQISSMSSAMALPPVEAV